MEVGAVVSREATPALLAPRASLSALRLHRRPASTHSRPPPPRARAHAPRPPPRAISSSQRSLGQASCFGWRSAASGRSAASTAALLDDIQVRAAAVRVPVGPLVRCADSPTCPTPPPLIPSAALRSAFSSTEKARQRHLPGPCRPPFNCGRRPHNVESSVSLSENTAKT